MNVPETPDGVTKPVLSLNIFLHRDSGGCLRIVMNDEFLWTSDFFCCLVSI